MKKWHFNSFSCLFTFGAKNIYSALLPICILLAADEKNNGLFKQAAIAKIVLIKKFF